MTLFVATDTNGYDQKADTIRRFTRRKHLMTRQIYRTAITLLLVSAALLIPIEGAYSQECEGDDC